MKDTIQRTTNQTSFRNVIHNNFIPQEASSLPIVSLKIKKNFYGVKVLKRKITGFTAGIPTIRKTAWKGGEKHDG